MLMRLASFSAFFPRRHYHLEEKYATRKRRVRRGYQIFYVQIQMGVRSFQD
jgi:hypothetical protein